MAYPSEDDTSEDTPEDTSEGAFSIILLPSEVTALLQALQRTSPKTDTQIKLLSRLQQLRSENSGSPLLEADDSTIQPDDMGASKEKSRPKGKFASSAKGKSTSANKGKSHSKRKQPADWEEGMASMQYEESNNVYQPTEQSFLQAEDLILRLTSGSKFSSTLTDLQGRTPESRPSSQTVIQTITDDLLAQNPLLKSRQIKDWRGRGSKWARLAGAGSIYLLVLVACLSLRTFCYKKMSVQGLEAFGNLLRTPDHYKTRGDIHSFLGNLKIPLKRRFLS
ncbi:hypothetical protein K435DRAFT_801340 [Dendrothele bispora CBS 962.96]|uniref:Uncharacterized protein n=1 Tax=Dendrothele bispora (strain CBS 962.96) TaxID=1314807 RepID=A0A4S8LQ82_DENBC|nr:hypothetical protein K435DRAFT_801340 [Dendrothele bispora CBS 962.96]